MEGLELKKRNGRREGVDRLVADVPSEFKHQLNILAAVKRSTISEMIIQALIQANPELGDKV